MRCLLFSTKPYDRAAFTATDQRGHTLFFQPSALHLDTAALADGFPAVCLLSTIALTARC